MELVETAKSFLESLENVEDLSDNTVTINLEVLSKLLSTVSFYADEDTLKALMCEIIDAKAQCTKSISKEIIIEEKEGKTETSEKRKKMIFDTRNMLSNAEIGFLTGIASYRELQQIELERIQKTCDELDMPFKNALSMIDDLRKIKGFDVKEETKAIVLPVNNIGKA